MGDDIDNTTFHVRRAQDGVPDSLEWIINRFTPGLLISAERRMGPHLRRIHDPEDVVNELWMAVIPRFSELVARDNRMTPVLLRYLAASLISRINNLARAAIRGARRLDGGNLSDPDDLAVQITGVVTLAARGESNRHLREALDKLSETDREIVILRGIEQGTNLDVAKHLGIEPGAAAIRYHRALARLRQQLPGSFLDDLEAA